MHAGVLNSRKLTLNQVVSEAKYKNNMKQVISIAYTEQQEYK